MFSPNKWGGCCCRAIRHLEDLGRDLFESTFFVVNVFVNKYQPGSSCASGKTKKATCGMVTNEHTLRFLSLFPTTFCSSITRSLPLLHHLRAQLYCTAIACYYVGYTTPPENISNFPTWCGAISKFRYRSRAVAASLTAVSPTGPRTAQRRPSLDAFYFLDSRWVGSIFGWSFSVCLHNARSVGIFKA